jgi:hypothetical protein
MRVVNVVVKQQGKLNDTLTLITLGAGEVYYTRIIYLTSEMSLDKDLTSDGYHDDNTQRQNVPHPQFRELIETLRLRIDLQCHYVRKLRIF